MTGRSILKMLLVVAIAAIFAAFLGWPIARVLSVAFFGNVSPGEPSRFSLLYLAAVFQDRELRIGLMHSTLIAVCVTSVTTFISLPLAWLTTRFEFPGKRIAGTLLLLPLVLPPFVGAIGMRQILGRFGALTAIMQRLHLVAAGSSGDWFGGRARFVGIVLLESLGLYPILLLNLSAAWSNIDPAMQQAAANLGAGRAKIFRRITLPLLRPGLLAGTSIVMIWSFTELGTPLMFEFYRVTPVQIFFRLTQINASPVPFALVVIMLITAVLLYLIGKRAIGRQPDAAISKATIASSSTRLHGWRAALALAPLLLVALLAMLPHVGVILLSLAKTGSWYDSIVPRQWTGANYRTALVHDLTLPSMRNSIALALASTTIDVLLGLAIAWLVVRSTWPRAARTALDALAMLPLAVPGLVLAFGFLAISVRFQAMIGAAPSRRWLRNLVDVQENPAPLLIVAYAMRRLPYVVRSAVAGLEQTPVDLERAAQNLGASRSRTMRLITIPLLSASLIAGALLAFAFAMLEVSDSLILAQKQTYWPITKAIYELFDRLGDGPSIAAALGVWAMLILAIALMWANQLLGRRVGTIFKT